MAVISLLFSATATWPRLILLAVAQALTRWRADLPVALSKLCRRVLPSMGITWPAATSCSSLIQATRQRLNWSGLRARKMALKRSCEGMPLGEVEELTEPFLLLACPIGDGHEVVGPGDGGAADK